MFSWWDDIGNVADCLICQLVETGWDLGGLTQDKMEDMEEDDFKYLIVGG